MKGYSPAKALGRRVPARRVMPYSMELCNNSHVTQRQKVQRDGSVDTSKWQKGDNMYSQQRGGSCSAPLEGLGPWGSVSTASRGHQQGPIPCPPSHRSGSHSATPGGP